MKTTSPSHNRAIEGITFAKKKSSAYKSAVKVTTSKTVVKAKKASKLDIGKLTDTLFSTNFRQNMAFYKYFFIVTFSLLMVSLLWNSYLYGHASNLQSRVNQLGNKVESLIDTVETFGKDSFGGGDPETEKPTETETITQFVTKNIFEFNYENGVKLTDVDKVVALTAFPLVIPDLAPVLSQVEKISLDKQYLSREEDNLDANRNLMYSFYAYKIKYSGYEFYANAGFYPTGGTCDKRYESYETKYGKLSICDEVTVLAFDELTEQHNFPMTYTLTIIDSSLTAPLSVFTELMNSMEVVDYSPTK